MWPFWVRNNSSTTSVFFRFSLHDWTKRTGRHLRINKGKCFETSAPIRRTGRALIHNRPNSVFWGKCDCDSVGTFRSNWSYGIVPWNTVCLLPWVRCLSMHRRLFIVYEGSELSTSHDKGNKSDVDSSSIGLELTLSSLLVSLPCSDFAAQIFPSAHWARRRPTALHCYLQSLERRTLVNWVSRGGGSAF